VRTIAHLSDLHFGQEDPRVVEALVRDVAALRPSLVAVSGDLTQRARRPEFAAARAFLDRLPAPRLVVPGNHDVPLLNVLRRFLDPLGRFRDAIGTDPDPVFEDEELVVVGVSTARSNVWKEGRISGAQIAHARRALRVAHGRLKVLVAHHPFVPPRRAPEEKVTGRALRALRAFEREHLDLVLTGHLHLGHSGDVREHFECLGRSMLTAHASTAVSRRRRGDPNSYNLLTVSPERIALEVRAFDGTAFVALGGAIYERVSDGWADAAGA
jgi:3',5'-cyclic AMP phosphodiesterase CpdA